VVAKHFFDSVYLTRFSQPKCDRVLYRFVKKHRISNLIEIGISDLQRSLRMIRLACHASRGESEIRYTGIDLFEARPKDQSAMTLKETHRSFTQSGATVRLIPGDPVAALCRYANHLAGSELLLLSNLVDQNLGSAWYYLPRMLAPNAVVFLESAEADVSQTRFQLISAVEVKRRAKAAERAERKAA